MTPERIAELRALCKAATPEPWKNAFRSIQVPDGEGRPPFDIFVGDEDDVAFIAAARTALPEALDAIERVRAKIKVLSLYNLKTDDYTINAERELLAALEGVR